MGESSVTVGGAFDEIVDRFGGVVADPSLMPVGDLVMPTPRRYRPAVGGSAGIASVCAVCGVERGVGL